MNELRYEAPEVIVVGTMDEVFLGVMFEPFYDGGGVFSGSW